MNGLKSEEVTLELLFTLFNLDVLNKVHLESIKTLGEITHKQFKVLDDYDEVNHYEPEELKKIKSAIKKSIKEVEELLPQLEEQKRGLDAKRVELFTKINENRKLKHEEDESKMET